MMNTARKEMVATTRAVLDSKSAEDVRGLLLICRDVMSKPYFTDPARILSGHILNGMMRAALRRKGA